jgi:hypothetical protein
MASGRVIDSYPDHEFTDTMLFLQLFPSGRLTHHSVPSSLAYVVVLEAVPGHAEARTTPNVIAT